MTDELKLFNELAELLLKEEKNHPVATPIQPKNLNETLDLKLNDHPMVDEELKARLTELIKATPKTASTSFFNQLFGGRMPKATLGDLLGVMLNNSMYTYKVAGPQVGIEKEVLNKICEIIRYKTGSDGTFASGGSMSNFMAVLMARDRFDQSIRQDGVQQKMILYTSELSHYSIVKNASFIGIGRKQVRFIKADETGKMFVKELEKQIQKDIQGGFKPFFVNATAGTTVLGAFDAIAPISNICKTYKLWLHVDGAYCGGVIFSKKHKHLIDGLHLSDSFSFNAHKMLGTPLTCSILLTQDAEQLHRSFSNEAEYLYQTDDDYYNLGKTSLQCGRRNDALKIWTLWKSIGTIGLEKMVDHQFHLADVARNYIKNNSNYELISDIESISVCFNYKYVPAKELCTLLYEQAELMVGFGTFEDKEFVRMVTINSVLKEEDIMEFFKTIEQFIEERHNLQKI